MQGRPGTRGSKAEDCSTRCWGEHERDLAAAEKWLLRGGSRNGDQLRWGGGGSARERGKDCVAGCCIVDLADFLDSVIQQRLPNFACQDCFLGITSAFPRFLVHIVVFMHIC